METNQTTPEAGPAPDDAKENPASAGPSAERAAGSAASGAAGASGAATPASATGTGIYAWLRRLGVPRRAGWLGGVCAGIGARLGIDPIIVRGIVVVAAVFGAPFVLVYAIAWLLLPDVEGEIHLERLMRGIVDPAIVGIAVMGVIGFIPLVQGGWRGWPEWPAPFRVLWVLVVIAGITAFVVWLARRASRTSPGGGAPRMASAPAAAAGNLVTPDADSETDASASAPPVPAGERPTAELPSIEPPVPAEGADAATLAEWRAQHEAWRVSHAEWKQGQQHADREARALAAAENKAKARALAGQAEAARRARRAAKPRASAAYVFTVFGLAIVAAAITAISVIGSPGIDQFALAITLAVATLVIASGMFIAAVRRRRSGVLAFAASVTTVLMLGNALAPGAIWAPWSAGFDLNQSRTLVQPVGNAQFYLGAGPHDTRIEITQAIGQVSLDVHGDQRVLLDATAAGAVDITWFDSRGMAVSGQSLETLAEPLALGGDPGTVPGAELVVRQWVGRVHVYIHDETEQR